jgi:RND superfamily putative drug exporter
VLSQVPVRHAKVVLAVAVAVAVCAGALGWSAPSHLSFKLRDLYSHDSESFRTMHLLETAHSGVSLGPPDLIVIVEREAERAADRTRDQLAQLPQIAAVSPYSFPSVDGQSHDFFAWLKPGLDEGSAAGAVAQAVSGPEVIVGSPALARRQLGEVIDGEVNKAELIALPLLLILALWVFRSFVAAMLPVVVGGVSLLCSLGTIRALNCLFPLSVFAVNIAAALALGLGVDYSLLMVSRFREELASGRSPRASALITVRTAGRTIGFSAAVIACSFSSLFVFPIPLARSFAVGGIVVALTACAVALITLPALFSLLGPRVNALAPKVWKHAVAARSRPLERGPWYRLARFVMRRPLPVALASSTLLVVIGVPALTMRFTGFDVSSVSSQAEARVFTEQIRGEFSNPLIGEIEVAIHGSYRVAKSVERQVDGLSERTGLAAPFPILFRLSSNLWRVNLNPTQPLMSTDTQNFVRQLRSMDARISVTGETASYMDMASTARRDLPVALALLVTGSFVVLFLATGSLVLPIKTLLMNLLSLGAAFGLLVLIFQDGKLSSLLDFEHQSALIILIPIFVAVGAFGLLTDYGLFLIMRIKEAREDGLSDREAIPLGLETTSRIITAAALLFSVAVGAFASSGILLVKAGAVGIVCAVLFDAFIVRLFLVPSLMSILGRWNWWPRSMEPNSHTFTRSGKTDRWTRPDRGR